MSQPSIAPSTTPPKLSPAAETVLERCRNCDAALVGPFCADCGQRHHEHLDPSLREIAHEAGGELLHLDGKLVETVRLLLTRPGQLTREFLAGRRSRYVSPLKLYLTCSVLFFFMVALVPSEPGTGIGTIKERRPDGSVVHRPLNAEERDSLAQMLERKAKKAGGAAGAFYRGLARAEAQPALARHAMVQAMPKIMFVLVPFFAFVTGLVYRRRGLHYPTHLIFALHVFAFYFTVSAVAQLVRLADLPELATLARLVAVLVTIGYLALAMRRMYGGRRRTTALRLAVMVAVFGVGVLLVIATSALLVLGWGTPGG